MMIFSFPAQLGMMRRGGGFIPLVRLVVLPPRSLFPGALVEGVGFLRAVLRLARRVVSKELRWLVCTKGGGLRRAVEATTTINVDGHPSPSPSGCCFSSLDRSTIVFSAGLFYRLDLSDVGILPPRALTPIMFTTQFVYAKDFGRGTPTFYGLFSKIYIEGQKWAR